MRRKFLFIVLPIIILSLILISNLVQAGTITANVTETNMNSIVLLTGTGFSPSTNYYLIPRLENKSAWWDGFNENWLLSSTNNTINVTTDGSGNFNYNLYIPNDWRISGGRVSFKVGESVASSLLWSTQGTNWLATLPTKNGVTGDNNGFIYTASTSAAANQGGVEKFYKSNGALACKYNWTAAVTANDITNNGSIAYVVTSATSNNLQRINMTDCGFNGQQTTAAVASYSVNVAPNNQFIIITYAATADPRKYMINVDPPTEDVTFNPTLVASIGYDSCISPDSSVVYVGYANGNVTALSATTGALIWMSDPEETEFGNAGYAFPVNGLSCDNDRVYVARGSVAYPVGITEQGFVEALWASNGSRVWVNSKTDTIYDGMDVNNIRCDSSYCYAVKLITPAPFAGVVGSAIVQINKTNGNVTWQNWRSWLPTTYQGAYGSGGVHSSAQTLWIDTDTNGYLYPIYTNGWVQKIAKNDVNSEIIETNLWIRGLTNFWNYISDVPKNIWLSNETPYYNFRHWDQKGMPLNTSATNLLGTFFRYSMLNTFNSFTAYEYSVSNVLGNSIFINPIIQVAPTQINEVRYFNGAYHTSCPIWRYSPGLVGWHYQDRACLYEEIPATLAGYNIGTTINGTFISTTIPYALIKTKFWENYPITKYYGADNWAWAAWYNTTNDQVLGFTTKFGSDQEDVYSDIYGRAVLFLNNITSYYRPQFRADLNRKTDNYIFFMPKGGGGNGNGDYMWSRIDIETQKIANPVNITLSSDESGSFTIGAYTYGNRIQFTAQEPNLFNRNNEPAEIIFNAVGGIRSDCQDVIITDTSDTPISLWQVDNSTACSQNNNVSVWIMMNWTQNEIKNLRLYYNSPSATPSASGTTDLVVATISGACSTNNHEVNITSTNWYNWQRPAAATASNEKTMFQFNDTTKNMWATTTHYAVIQYYKNSNTTGTGAGVATDTPSTSASIDSRCLQTGGTGKIFAKILATNDTSFGTISARPTPGRINVEYYFFANTGRVRIRTQLNQSLPIINYTVSKNWPPYYYFSIANFIPPDGANSWLYYSGLYEQMKKPVAVFNADQTQANLSSSPLPLIFTIKYGGFDNFTQANGSIYRPATVDGSNNFWDKGCTAHKEWQYYIYSGGNSYGTAAAPLYTSEFISCDKSLQSQLPQMGESGYVNVIPEMAWDGTTVNRWYDPSLIGKFYMMPNIYRPYNRENRFLAPYAITNPYALLARISSYIIPVCPEKEYGYKGYDDFLTDLPNLIANTSMHIRENTNNIPCATQVIKFTDQRGSDGTQIIFARNLSVIVGETISAGATYPFNTFASGTYTYQTNGELDLTFAQKYPTAPSALGYYGKYYFTYTPNNYVIHAFATSGNPQFMTTPATAASYNIRYSFAPESFYNKNVWDETALWDKTSQNFSYYRNPCWLGTLANLYGSTERGHAFLTTNSTPGWKNPLIGLGYQCAHNEYNLETQDVFRPGWSSIYPTAAGAAAWNELIVDGRMNFAGIGNPTEAGADTYYFARHASLFDYKHSDDFTSVLENIDDLNQDEKHPNKQPWYCQISRHTNRSFCVMTNSLSSLIYNVNPGGGLTNTAPYSPYWTSVEELATFRNYFVPRFFDASAWLFPYDHSLDVNIYPTLGKSEVLMANLLYTSANADDYETFFRKQFPTASYSLQQTQFLLKDWKNSAFIYFDTDSRNYAAGLPMSLNGIAILNGNILNDSNITLGIYNTNDNLIQEIETTTNSSGMFNWTLTLPSSMSTGLYYVQFNYNNTIIDSVEFRTIGLIASTTSNEAAYEQGQEVTTTITITNSYTGLVQDPDQLELRYLNPSSQVVECAKYPETANVTGCENNLTKISTGVYTYVFSIGSNPLGVYTQRATVTEDGIAADFDRGFVVALIDPCKANDAYSYALNYSMSYNNVTDVLTIIGNDSMGTFSNPITTEQMYEFAQATRGTCIIEKPATGTYTIKSQLVIGNGTQEVYVTSKGESIGFTTENMPQLFINKSAHLSFGGISNGIPQEGSSIKFTSNQSNDLLLDVAGGELAFYDSYVGDVGDYLGRFIYRGSCGNLSEEYSSYNSSIIIKKTIFDRATRGQFFFTSNVTIDDMKINRINSSASDGYGIVSGCNLPSLNNLQIYHQEQLGGGIFIMNNTPANTDLIITSSTLDYNLKDVIANKEGRGVQLINTQWDRTYGFNYSGSWSGTTQIKESYGYLPSIVDASSNAIVNSSIVLIDRYGNIKLLVMTDSAGTISEQNIPTWQVEKSASESTSDFNPFNLKIKKYGKTFVSEPKTFSVRTVETKQLTTNPFTYLNETSAKSLTGIAYTPPTKVSYADEETELVGADDIITLDNFPVSQSEFFGLYNDTGSTIPSSAYVVDYATGNVTFINGYEAVTVRAVYNYGGSIQIIGDKTISQIYDFMQANLSDVFTTQTGSIYDSYVHIILGNSSDTGTIREISELTLNFKEGYGFSSENNQSTTVNLQSDTWNFTWIGNVNKTFSRKYALDLLVTYSNGTAMEGANVTIKTIGNENIFNELTNASGRIPHQEISYATYNHTDGSNATLLSPHTIEIIKSGYITSSTSVTIDSIQDLTYALYEESNPCDPDDDYAYALTYPISYNLTTDVLTVIGNSTFGSASNSITFDNMFEFARATKGSCIMQKPATGTYAVLSQLIVGNGTQEVYITSKGESIGFSSANMPELTINNLAHVSFGGIADGIPQEGSSIKFASNASNDLLLDVAGGELAFYDSYITDAGTSWGRFLFRGGCGNESEGTYSSANSSITIKKTIFDRATRGQFLYTNNVTIDDMKVNRINSTANDGFGLVAGCNMPALNNLQIYHQEQTGGGIRTLENMPADTSLTITSSTLDYNLKDVIANKEGRGVQLINTQWDRTYGFNYSGSWEGTTAIKESYGYNPTFVDTSSSPIANLTLVLINQYGEVEISQETESSGGIGEQYIPTWQVEKTDSAETTSNFNPYTLYAKKYLKVFISEPKSFASRTLETKQVSTNSFTILSEETASAVKNITYNAPTKVSYGNEVNSSWTTLGQLTHYPVDQCQYFALFANGTKLAETSNYTINYETGEITFVQNMVGMEIKPVYFYGGNITITNGFTLANAYTMSKIYDYISYVTSKNNLSEDLKTIDGITYTFCVNFVIGNDTHRGSVSDSSATISFEDGYDMSFSGLGGYVDLAGITSGGGSSGGLPLNIFNSVGSSYAPGNTVYVFSTVLNNNGQLVDATVNLDIYLPNGTLYENGAMTATSTGRLDYNLILPGGAQLGTWRVDIDATYGGSEVHDNVAFLVSTSAGGGGGGGTTPSIQIDAPSAINTNENFGILAFARNNNSLLVNCDSGASLTLKDTANGTILLNSVSMTNLETGKYNYTASLAYQSTFLTEVTCAILGTTYVSNPKIISSQNVPTNDTGGTGGSAYPIIELSASSPIATSTLSSIGALVKSSTGIPVNCDSDLKITIRNLTDSSSTSGNMTNFGTGMYNYSWTTPATASVFYVNASCSISGTTYTGFTTISTQNVSTPTSIDYNEIANYVWSYTSRNLTYYNQSIAENIQNCLKDAQCSGWWINSTLTKINTTINTINSTASQIKSDTETLLNYINCNQTNEVCTRLQNILNNATDIQSRVYSLNTSQIPALQTSINNTYTDTQYIRTNMATASALSSMQTDVTWLLNNVATQTNITLINSKLDTINSTVNTIKTQTDCSSPANSVLCTYLNGINTTVNTIYSEMATKENISTILSDTNWLVSNVATQENMTETFSRLTTINNTINSISSDLLNINSSLQTKIDNVQNNVTWLIDNVAVQEDITEIMTRLTEINSTTNEIDDSLDNEITNRLTEINTTTQNTYSYILANVSTQKNITEVINEINNIQLNISFIKNNMFYQGNATGSFLVDYLSTVFAESGKSVELWILTRDLLGNSKTVSEAICDIRKQGIWIANATTTINSGGVYASWNVTQNISFGAYYWNCTLTGSTVSLQVPFFISGEFGITSLVSASPKYPNENAIVEATFANQNGSVEPDTINLTIWKPNYLTVWYTANKTGFSRNGEIWSWTQMIESSPTTGTYYVQMEASYNDIKDSKTTQFRIATGGPYMIFLECPSSSNVGENLACTVKIQDEGEAATESTSTVWVDTDNDGVADAGEPQTSFSKQTVPLQNVTQSVSINVPSSHSTGSYVVRVDTSYANSGQPNSGASDSVTFSTAPAGGDSGTGGGSSGGSSSGTTARFNADFTTKNAVTFNAVQGNSKTFTFDGTTSHSIKIESISGSTVTFVISSNPITITMNVGEIKEVDLNRDRLNDIRINLKKINNGVVEYSVEKLEAGVARITGETIEHPEHLMDISTRILDEYKVINPGDKVLMEVTLFNLGTEEIKDLRVKYCIETNGREIIKCNEETVAVYTKVQLVKEFLISQDMEYGEYFIKTEAFYNNNNNNNNNNNRVQSETSFEVKGDLFNIKKNLMINYLLPISLGMIILILLIVIISIYKKRRKTKEVKLKLIPLETKLRQLNELKSRGAINKEAYISEKNKLLSRFKEIAKKSKIFVSLIFVGIFISTVMLISNRKIIGMVIENIDSSINKKLVIFATSILAIVALFLALREKIPCYFKRLGEFIDYLWNKHKKYPANSIKGLINKKVYSENGFCMGKVKEVILGKNRIESLKIKIDKKYKCKAKGIIMNYRYVKNVGEMIIIGEKILEYINDFKS